ncbi:MAG: leucine-rich repeat domain-containing protein [Candidatus Paracaedibacter sp.]
MKKIASISLIFINTIYGMENSTPALLDSNQPHEQSQSITFEEIKKQFEAHEKKTSEMKPKIIFALTRIMREGTLKNKDKKEAEDIARKLGAENLALRLQQYKEIKQYGDLNVLPEDVIKLIIHSVAKGATAKEIKNLLLVNKSFHAAMIDAPVSFDFSIPSRWKKYDPIMEEETGSDYEENKSINDHVIQILVQIFPNIEKLNLRNTQITDVGLSYLKEAKNLQSLNIRDCEQHLSYKNDGITREGLKNLSQLTSLRWLNLSGMPITDETLKDLSNLKNLETLIFRGGHITSTGFNHLLKLKNHLKRLSLAFCQDGHTNEELLKFLQSMELIALDLTNTKINDEGIEQLNKKIKFLNLDQTPITAKSINALENLEDLTFLRLGYQFSGGHRIEEENLKQLVVKFPHLNITWDGGTLTANEIMKN